MSTCSLNTYVRNSKGEVVESQLWKDLTLYLSDRDSVKTYYDLSRDSEFRESHKLEFDENNEVTFDSLRKAASIKVDKERVVNRLSRQLGSGIYDYTTAIQKVDSFNSSNRHNDFMATIKQSDKGKYYIGIVERSDRAVNSMERTVRNRELQDRIIHRLAANNIAVDFLEEGSREGGRYDTINAEKTADGMYHVIKVSHGENITLELAEEAGHFVVGALGNNPLVTRLQESLTDKNVIDSIVKHEHLEDKDLGLQPQRELAGYLVGRAIMNEVDKSTWYGRLAHRIWNTAKKVFYTFKGNAVGKLRLEAEEAAAKLARNFMDTRGGNKFVGDTQTALDTPEILFSDNSVANTAAYRECINQLRYSVAELKNIDFKSKVGEDVSSILTTLNQTKGNIINSTRRNDNTFNIIDNVALEGITDTVDYLLDQLGPGKTVNQLVDSVDLNNPDIMGNMSTYISNLNQAVAFLTTISLIQKRIGALIVTGGLSGDLNNVMTQDELGVVTRSLIDINRKLGEATTTILTIAEAKRAALVSRFYEKSMGKKYAGAINGVVFNWTKKRQNKKGKTGFTYAISDSEVNASESDRTWENCLRFLDHDIDLWHRFVGAMADSSDAVGRATDVIIKRQNNKADQNTMEFHQFLKASEAEFSKLGIKSEVLFERDAEGELTGNIISSKNVGQWENEYKALKYKVKEDFLNEVVDQVNGTKRKDSAAWKELSSNEQGMIYHEYAAPIIENWHNLHSTHNEDLSRIEPNDNYKNTEFEKLYKGDFKVWYDKWIAAKSMLDDLLPEGATRTVRMPQFRGSFHDVRQRSGIKEATRQKLIDTFAESSVDRDFGSDVTYNSEEEELFDNKYRHERKQINRVAVFGINKLQDMNTLTKDIFQGMQQYAAMAYSYNALNEVTNVLTATKDILKNRTTGEGFTDDDTRLASKGSLPRAFTAYCDYVDKQLFNLNYRSKTIISEKKIKKWDKLQKKEMELKRGIILEKVAGCITRQASLYFLRGNLVGGMVNTFTGFNELLKESTAGDAFNFKDFIKAVSIYEKNTITDLAQMGQDIKEDKVNLFNYKFNALADNQYKFSNWRPTHKKSRVLWNLMGKSLMAPYSSGDHFMHMVTYIASGLHTKIYDANGKETNLWDAYKVKDSLDETGEKHGKKLEFETTYYKSAEGAKEAKIVESIQNKLNTYLSAKSSNPLATISLSDEEQSYLDKNNLSLAREDALKTFLKERLHSLEWTQTDDADFATKCREVNIRLHGLYNRFDKSKFFTHWYSAALMAMRGYAIGMIEHRFSNRHYSDALGHDVEGYVNTYFKYLMNIRGMADGSFVGWFRSIGWAVCPFIGKTKLAENMKRVGFADDQIQNMYRSASSTYLMVILHIIRMVLWNALGNGWKWLIKKDDDDDDDKKNKPLSFISKSKKKLYERFSKEWWLDKAYYLISRVEREQQTFNWAPTFYQESASLTDLVPIAAAAMYDVGLLCYQTLGLAWADKSDSSFYYQKTIPGKYDKGDTKAMIHLYRIMPYLRNYYIFNNGVKAYSDFEYGTNKRSR